MAITVINLYAVRLLLCNMGEDDYGTFNAVAGVVLTSAFITSTLAISIQRFYSYALGEGKKEELSHIFSASMNIILAVSIVLFVLLETVGLWFVNTELSIPQERSVAANLVFQFSLVTLWFSLLQLPFTAAIFAHEEMGAFALISLTECLLRLGAVVFIGITSMDGLVFYGASLFAVAVIVFFFYFLIVRHRYPEYKYHPRVKKGIYKSLLSFSGWTMYSALAGIGVTQGVTILLYMFFGSITTAAYAISLQVLHAFQALSNSVVVAFRPAMVKSYAEKNYAFLDKMFSANNKLILFLLLSVAVPLIIELPTIFNWWLSSVSKETIIYTRLIIIYMVCFSMHNPITTIIQSTGHVKYYSLCVDSAILMCVPCTWLAFRLEASSDACVILMVCLCLVAHLIRLVILHHLYPSFNFIHYLYDIVLKGLIVALFAVTVASVVHHALYPGIIRLISVFAASCISLLLTVYVIGLSREERMMIHRFILARISNFPFSFKQ